MASPPPQPSTIKAWLYSSTTGGLEQNLILDKAARAPTTLRSDEVLIEVTSAALNPADYKVPEMGLPARLVIGMPASPGLDFCGRVAATGPEVTEFKAGDMIFGSHNQPVKFGALGQ
jgi:NADPH:quinone reductase-like Zn-dependent oxidoreductase